MKKLHKLDDKPTTSTAANNVFTDDTPGTSMDADTDWIDEPKTIIVQLTPRQSPRKKCDLQEDLKAQYKTWKGLIPTLVKPLLAFLDSLSGKATPGDVHIPMCTSCDGQKSSRVLCLFWDRKSLSRLCISMISY